MEVCVWKRPFWLEHAEEMGLEWNLERMGGDQKGSGHDSEESPRGPVNTQSLNPGCAPETVMQQACGGAWDVAFPAC